MPPNLYGSIPKDLIAMPSDAVQFSPLMPGAALLDAQAPETLDDIVVMAPPGTVERRTVLALALRALKPEAPFTILAPKDRGGSRLGAELEHFGCAITEEGRRHHRLCTGRRPKRLNTVEEAIAAGAPRIVEPLALWSQPGIFSWDRLDPGSALLLQHMPALAGHGADLGCGIGVLAKAALASPKVKGLTLIDIDRRAVEAARHNIEDARASFRWADVRQGTGLSNLDFVIMNPPFHDTGAEDRSLGQTFIRQAAAALRRGGRCWLTANRHLPYEAVLGPLFRTVQPLADAAGFKIIEAQK